MGRPGPRRPAADRAPRAGLVVTVRLVDASLAVLAASRGGHRASARETARPYHRREASMARVSVHVTVDGVPYVDDVEPRTLLVHYLREQLGKVGTVVGCDTGNCGACTVLLAGPDGPASAVKSCSVLAVQTDGGEVTTIEGLAGPGGELHPMQRAFHENHALQCGFC